MTFFIDLVSEASDQTGKMRLVGMDSRARYVAASISGEVK